MAKEGTGMQGLAHIVGGRDSIDPPSHRTWKWPKSGRYGGRRGRAAETPSSKTAIARGPPQSLQRVSSLNSRLSNKLLPSDDRCFCGLENSFRE